MRSPRLLLLRFPLTQLSLIAAVGLLLLTGCGGGGSGGNNDNTVPTTRLAPVHFDIQWGQRTRSINAPSSALSAVLTLTAAREDDSDFTYTVNRDTANLGAYTQNIVTPTQAKTRRWQMVLRFFAGADGTGAVVGVAGDNVTLASDGSGIGDVATQNTIKSVSIPNGQSLNVGDTKDLVYTCQAADGSLISVSPGSVTLAVVDGADSLQIANGQIHAVKGGATSTRVTATVDGVISAPIQVLVTGGTDPAVPVVKNAVVVLPQDSSVAATDLQSDGSLTLSGNVPALAPGTVLVSGQGEGYLRKVDSVSADANGVVLVSTSQASLTDVFSQLNLVVSKPLAASDFAEITPTLPGVTVNPPTRAVRGRDTDVASINFHFGNTLLGGDPGGAVSLDGDVNLKLRLDLAIEIDVFGVKHVRFLPTIEDSGTMALTASSRFSSTIKKKFTHLQGKPYVTFIGPVPFVVLPVLDLYTRFDGSIEAGVSQSVTASLTLGAGTEYQRGQGWHTITVFDPHVEFTALPNVFASLTFSYTPDYPELTLLIEGVAGPFFGAEAPRWETQFSVQTNPAQIEIKGDAVFQATSGFKVQVLGYDIADKELDGAFSLDERLTIFDKTFPYSSTDQGGLNLGIH